MAGSLKSKLRGQDSMEAKKFYYVVGMFKPHWGHTRYISPNTYNNFIERATRFDSYDKALAALVKMRKDWEFKVPCDKIIFMKIEDVVIENKGYTINFYWENKLAIETGKFFEKPEEAEKELEQLSKFYYNNIRIEEVK